MLGFLAKIFGSKSERDIKALQPLVQQINEEYAKLSSLSNDDLRQKTTEFKATIADALSDIDTKIADIKIAAENQELSLQEKTAMYDEVDALGKERDVELEKVLLQIMPSAFATIKETSRRLSENENLEVTATQFDRDYAARKSNVKIVGDKALWANKWDASGTEVLWNMVHYDVQLIGGMVLNSGKIAEMATGEGKTLVSTLPAYLNALAGQGVHIVTVNDYLARRDSEWNGPLFEFHGLKVDCIDKHEPNSQQRRDAYLADITYGTNNEFGFDYLRDNMSQTPDQLVQRKLHFAMVDEVDSVLIDDARTPLIISGPVPFGDQHEFHELKPRIERLVNAQKTFVSSALNEAKKLINDGKTGTEEGEGGLALLRAHRGLPKSKALIKFLSEGSVRQTLLKTENHYMADQSKNMPKVDSELFFYIDEKNNQVELTEKGIELITQQGEDANFFILPDVGTAIAEIEKSDLSSEEKIAQKDALMRDYSVKAERIHSVNQLLKAYTLFEIDVEYIIDEGKIKIVDEQTGRIMDGRRYSDGLHQAIEAKENVKVEDASQTYATVTLQNFFRMYHKLCGMTGTATTEAGEFWSIYKLDVVEIPTNRVMARKDEQDYVYRTIREKYNAVAEEIVKLTEAGRPVLVGTTSVEISELLSRMLKLRGIKHNVLNAKMHQKEADIVAEAGQAGTVTIATNMAGRGTDIKLGPGVKEAGGLAIVGTERHESRRVDRQLRGRAGRQGDPGTSQFFVSLEDNLMRLFGSERISNIMVKMGIEDGEVIQHSMITNSIERAQKKVEENNFGVRKRLLEYDDVMNSQRTVIYAKRRNALFGDRLDVDMNNMVFDVAEDIVTEYKEQSNYEGFKLEVIKNFSSDTSITENDFNAKNIHTLTDVLFEEVTAFYARKSEGIINQSMQVLKQVYAERGQQIEQVVVPFSDGIRHIQVPVNLQKAIDNNGREVTKAFEKTIILALIDDSWKEHLREMDELKQSVQNAVYEQKDPLIIYKMEAFNLFKSMLNVVNKEVVSFLYKGGIPVQQDAEDVREVQAPKRTQSKLQMSKPEFEQSSSSAMPMEDTREVVPQQPIRKEATVGRNEPCPCGSGKKFKNCHGANA
ncbi:preprotein translocase subunit SecA [Pedobacter frigiditerrae]|uniref:Protein translocase subunit SecA n=1 Tax=Pedobacter frigiditerrae TaxID=2530452 RepID=A0A4R0N202_9SPHI|nr:preprotein translocase subunit SecA [Pedobacter frigiditerrae]TCC93347.1 preprotein translocase subunit SecA [Pedobacter frigiditerrae]